MRELCGARLGTVKSIGTLASASSVWIRKTAFFQAWLTSRRFRREVDAPCTALRKQRRLVNLPSHIELQCDFQRASVAPPHAEGDWLSGATSDREAFAFCAPAGVVGGVPLT